MLPPSPRSPTSYAVAVSPPETQADPGFCPSYRTGDEAVVLIDCPDGFHAVVTDIHMPGERDGIAVGRHARRRHPTIPVIYTTGRPGALSGTGPLGHRDVLVRKPYAPSQVVIALRRFLPATGDAD